MRAQQFFGSLVLAASFLLAFASVAHAQDASTQRLIAKARVAITTDPRGAISILDHVEQRARALPAGRERTISLASALWLRGELHLRDGELDPARSEVARALWMIEPIREPIELRGDLLKAQGTLQSQEGQAAQALDNFQRAYAIYQQLGNARSQSIALQHIASLYGSANDDQRAVRYYRQAAETFDRDPALSLMIHNNLGNVLLQLERYRDAQAEYLKALGIAKRTNNKLLETRILSNVARNQVEAGWLDDAERTLRRGFALMQAEEAAQFRPSLYATAARVAFLRHDVARARKLIDRAFEGIDLAATPNSFRFAHLIAYPIYSAAGEPRRALFHLEAARRLSDETNKVATTTGAALMAARFDYANQELRIARLKADEANRRAQVQRVVFVGGAIVAAFIVGMLSFLLVTIRRSRNQVRAANAVLADTNEALGKALAAKTEFLATTSHEIRTPLNGILGMTQVMLADAGLDARVRERLGVVHGAGITMRALVDDILDVAKMETGNLTVDPAPMDLAGTLRDVARMWEHQASARGLGFTLDLDTAPGWIVSDQGRVRQIVFNLLSNALKFTERGSVGITVLAAGKRLAIVITDTGIGIPADKLEAVFESFRQADSSTTRRFGGTGLGLTICRNLARALGGDVRVESEEGRGSRFTLDLPLVLAEAPAQAAAASVEDAVLVLDRNPITRGMLRTVFETAGIATICAASREEAERLLAEGGVDRLLIDQASLSGAAESADASLAALAAAAREAGVASAILWPKPDDAVLARCREAGIGQVIGKPVAGTTLVQMLYPERAAKSQNPDSQPLVSRAA